MERVRLAVIMCVYKRLDKLPLTEEMLAKQTYKDFDFHIWNNAGEENVGGLGRFILASQLVEKYDYVIFIDDDQIFEDTFIEQMVKQAKPNTIAGWYAWENHGKYWDRTPATDKATYVGTGGMICDINAFRNEKILNIPSRYHYIEDLWLSFVCKYELGYRLEKANVDMRFMEGETIRDQFRTRNLKELKEDFYTYLTNEYNTI